MAIPLRTSSSQETAQRIAATPAKVAIALRSFARIAEAWQLSVDEARTLLGQPARATYFQWRSGRASRVPHDVIARISWLLGIWKALQILFPEPARADRWIRSPSELFAGQAPLERMLGGDVTDLAAVRAALDAARGGGL
jgi:hypothetical protein